MSTVLSIPSARCSLKANLANSASSPVLKTTVAQIDEGQIGTGSAAGQADRCISKPFVVTTGTPITIDVTTEPDVFGNAAGMVHVGVIMLQNLSTVAGQDMTMGAGTHPLTADGDLAQANGGVAYKKNPNPGWTVASGSADTITIAVAAGTNVAGAITIFGRSA